MYILDFSPLLCENYPERNSEGEMEWGRDHTFLYKFKVRSKRFFHWSVWERYTRKYSSYKEFKERWDPNISLREVVRDDIKSDIEKLVRIKNVLIWINRRRHTNKSTEFRRPKEFTPRWSDYYRDNRK